MLRTMYQSQDFLTYAKFSGVIQSQWFDSNIHGLLDTMSRVE